MLFPVFTIFIVLYAFSVDADEIKCGEVPIIADENLKQILKAKQIY
jgi:hypothetical protein